MLQDALKALRHQFRLTQKDVANALSVDRTTYTYYELGRSKPDFVTLCKLARFYGITIGDIEELSRTPVEEYDDVADDYGNIDDSYLDKLQNFFVLNREERELVFLFRACENKNKVLNCIKKINREESIQPLRKKKSVDNPTDEETTENNS